MRRLQDSLLVLPRPVEIAVSRYLRLADRLLSRRVVGFYVVGSAALGDFRAGRSDIDFVAVLDRDLRSQELRRLRLAHLLSGAATGMHAVRGGHFKFPGTCNGVFVTTNDLAKPVSKIVPVASHCAHEFHVGEGFDVNPVVWKILAERGIAVRGRSVESLGLRTEPNLLRSWNLNNLEEYWRPWAQSTLNGRRIRLGWGRWFAAWGVLGAPRLHHTIATGDVISKEAAGEYGFQAFDEVWHPIIAEALAYWRGQPATSDFANGHARRRKAAQFVLHVVEDAHRQ